MFSWIISKPAVILDLVLGSMLVVFGLYFWFANSEIARLNKSLATQTIQVQEDQSIIKSLNDRIALIQKLNDNFNKSVAVIENNQNAIRATLQSYGLSLKAAKDPAQASIFINDRNHRILSELNNMGKRAETGK